MTKIPGVLLRALVCFPILANLCIATITVTSTQTPGATPLLPESTRIAPQATGTLKVFIPTVSSGTGAPIVPPGPGDWPQAAHDAQRTNASTVEVDPPYCYSWKWYGPPIASRAQPVVSSGRLFIGGMDGVLYARLASTGSLLWSFSSGGPIRNSAAVINEHVIFTSYDGYTYALDARNGSLLWKTLTGSSATAPLIDPATSRIFVASTNGNLTSLNWVNGTINWTYPSGAAILTSPALSQDGTLVFSGNEAIRAFALDAAKGSLKWQTILQGESLSDRYPVVSGNAVTYRSQPLYFFHIMLQQYGDEIMDQAGAVNPDWNSDWPAVRSKITTFLNSQPQFQTYFLLNAQDGANLGTLPVLYTFGNGNTPAPPVYANGKTYLAYRARHGIQTDGGAVHVMTRYDAELGSLSGLDIAGLKNSNPLSGQPQFRMTSDEGAMLTMSGNLLLVDNWERLGAINVSNGQLVSIGNVSNDWPECNTQCGPGGPNPFFPLSGNKSDPAYPFPAPRSTEGNVRAGAVVADGMIYWRVIEAGLAGISHSNGGTCSAPKLWRDSAGMVSANAEPIKSAAPLSPNALSDYVTTDLTLPVANPPQALTTRLQNEVNGLLKAANGQHLMPFFTERGMTNQQVWPYTFWNSEGKTGLAEINFLAQGNAYWFDPGELLYTLAMAYPYIGNTLQSRVKDYLTAEMTRYPPLQDLPYHDANRDWLGSGSPREQYQVPFRSQINNWPPVAASLSTIYSLWLWSKNSGDFSYAQSHWAQVQSLFNSKKDSMRYYADLSGAIGYYRLATDLVTRDAANSAAYQAAATVAMQTAVAFMTSGTNFNTFLTRANTDFPDPRGATTGWSAPVFYGMTPEVGAFLAAQLGGQPQILIKSLESLNSSGTGLLWWYITQAGTHAEVGETAFLAPTLAWSHFLAHAYILKDTQAKLVSWLDRPWTPGDLYSIQKIVAAIQAGP